MNHKTENEKRPKKKKKNHSGEQCYAHAAKTEVERLQYPFLPLDVSVVLPNEGRNGEREKCRMSVTSWQLQI